MSIVPGSDVNGGVSVGRDALIEPRNDWTRAEVRALLPEIMPEVRAWVAKVNGLKP